MIPRTHCSSSSHALRCAALLLPLMLALPALASSSFVEFESGEVRPLALSPNGTQLFAVNTPDNRLEVYDVTAGGLSHVRSIPVGMEPVAVAVRADGTQAWVVNHLSDSISIIDLTAAVPHVVRTLLVGDEPRDIVFAGSNRAFITTAHRGQNTPLQANIDTVLTTPGIGRADVWVFDPANLGATLEGTPLTIVTLFGDTPRALAVSPDGSTVYAAVFHSGNQTTALSEGAVCNGGSAAPPCGVDGVTMPNGMAGGQVPGGLPAPNQNFEGTTGPEVGLIVKFNESNGRWEDRSARNWTNAVRFSLPDLDVFAIDATANPPAETASFAHVGTVLFNMVTNPVSGKLYVSNTDANNAVRFEGPGGGGSTVRGHLHEARITVIDGSTVTPHHLNPHIVYSDVPQPVDVKGKSLAAPTSMAVTSDGQTLYVAAFGSGAVGVFDTTELENDTFTPDAASHIPVTGGGPSGLVLGGGARLYVFTRFDDGISVIDTGTNQEIAHVLEHNPEPSSIVNGRRFLYDATATSSDGEASCSSCHIFGDFDSLAWDLGNPDDVVKSNPNPSVTGSLSNFHPLKGPMTTQTLRGMSHHGPMHWRGDRTGAYTAPNILPDSGAYDEDADFKQFQVAFDSLLGRDEGPLAAADMQAFTDFILQVILPPNPVRPLDNVLVGDALAGYNFFIGPTSDLITNCNGCHGLDASQGFFGATGQSSFENETQEFKVPHLNNLYQKVGMFGMPAVGFFLPGDNGDQGPQVRGFGFLHDGSTDTLLRFHRAAVFQFPSDTVRQQVNAFMFAFDSTYAPVVGQQITLTNGNGGTVGPRIDLFVAAAGTSFVLADMPGAHECDLIAKGVVDLEDRGYVYNPATQRFISDRQGELPLTDAQLRAKIDTAAESLTYTCAPPGSGTRMGVDRDEDGFLDRDELDAGSDPSDPTSIPGGGPTPTPIPTATPTPLPFCSTGPQSGCREATHSLLVVDNNSNKNLLVWKWLKGVQALDTGAFGDPTTGTRYGLCVYISGLTTAIPIAPGGPWRPSGSGFKYIDGSAAQNGVKRIGLKAGAAGKSKITFKGDGNALPVPPFLGLPVLVQLVNSNGECWQASYNTVIKNLGGHFKTKF